jgi:hypothetical protein
LQKKKKKGNIKIYKITILPVLFYGCGNWSDIIREELTLGLFENGVLRKIFGPKGRRL